MDRPRQRADTTLKDHPLIDVTTWTAHASREPSSAFLSAMDRHWRDGLASPATSCAWNAQRLHALTLLHVDRAAHKRRLRAQYVTSGHCAAGSHGFTPMSSLIPGDMYGPEQVDAIHTGDRSPLAAAIAAAKSDPHLVAVTVITEQQFVSIDAYDDHSGSLLRPEAHGAVVPVLYANVDEDEDDAFEREDLLRANGFATYTIDATMGDDPAGVHATFAAVIEDVFDEIAHMKADASTRVLAATPLWPLIVVRAPESWDPEAFAPSAHQRETTSR